MQVTITLDDAKVTKKLNLMIQGFSDFSEPLNKVGDDLLKYYGIEVFETQGGELAAPWRPLALSTLYMREHRSGYYRNQPIRTDKILIWTGRLQKGFKKEVGSTKLRIYNDVEYFKYHQKASGRPPQRPMLAINGRVIAMVVDHMNQFSEKVVNKN